MNRIPRTELLVSPVSFGTMNFGTPVGEAEAIELIRYAFDKGINLIDTANMYEGYARYPGSHGGVAEKIIGKAVKGARGKYIIATKFGMKVGDEPEDEGCGPAALAKQLDRSLSYLGTDYVDLFYAHKYDPNVAPEELAAAMEKAIAAGKIRYYGVSNYSGKQLSDLIRAADLNGLPRPVLCQPPLSLLKQDALTDSIAVCQNEDIGVIPYQILQGGLLSGKYRQGTEPPKGSRAEESDWIELNGEVFKKLGEIEAKAKTGGVSMFNYAVHWALTRPAVVSVLIGIKTREQIDKAVLAAGIN